MFLRRGFSLASYVNCAFDPLSYRKHVLACWQWNRMFRAFCYKKTAIWFFVSEYPFFESHSSENTFLYAGNKIALLWVLCHKKKRFCFFVAKTRWTQLYSTTHVWFEDFRYMKIHIFALRWRDVIKRSSQLRTLLKRIVVNWTWKKNSGPYGIRTHDLCDTGVALYQLS